MSRAKVDLDVTRERLDQAGLVHASEALDALLDTAVKSKDAPHRFLDRLLEHELGQREERRIKTSLRLSPDCRPARRWEASTSPSSPRSRRVAWRRWLPARGSARGPRC